MICVLHKSDIHSSGNSLLQDDRVLLKEMYSYAIFVPPTRSVQVVFEAEYQIMGRETGPTVIVTCFKAGSWFKGLTLNHQTQL